MPNLLACIQSAAFFHTTIDRDILLLIYLIIMEIHENILEKAPANGELQLRLYEPGFNA